MQLPVSLIQNYIKFKSQAQQGLSGCLDIDIDEINKFLSAFPRVKQALRSFMYFFMNRPFCCLIFENVFTKIDLFRVHFKLGTFCLIWNLSIFTEKFSFSRSGHTTIQDGLLNKSRDLFSKPSLIVVCPLRENESFSVKIERFQIKQNVPNLKWTLVDMQL